MPNQRPRAAFEPLPPDLDVPALVESTPNFQWAPKFHCNAIDAKGLESFEKLVQLHVVLGGMPLVVGGFNERLDNSLFSEKWLRGEYATKSETARNLTTKTNLPLTIGHYLKNMPLLTNQWNSFNYKEPNRQRIYLKDIDCPQQWHDYLKSVLPPFLFYLNQPDVAESSSNQEQATGVGDLMSCLPSSMRAENLMCYIGHEGTYTPAHQEMCASLGQNIMVEASDGLMEYGKVTKPGSSIWFMTESKDRHVVSEYWLSKLGHDIDVEDHFAQINAWKGAPFKTYIVEQRPGDFILVPPMAAHQVWNRGTRTMKVAWNRTTADTLKLALDEALPHARMVCRDEQYKNKAIVYYSLGHYSSLLAKGPATHTQATKKLQADFAKLFSLYTGILLSESFQNDMPDEKEIELIPFDGSITCSYCRSNLFNRFLTCPWCVGDENDTYDICMECYIMGRSCRCRSRLKWVEQFTWEELTGRHEMWRQQIRLFSAGKTSLLPAFSEARAQMVKKSPAQICQEQLKRRPWVDISKPIYEKIEDESSDSETSTPAWKRRKGNTNEERGRCHICKCTEPMWKLASCSICHVHYCYGSLFRAFNIQPQDTMETDAWVCPKCEKRCSCAACRRNPTMSPSEPMSTLLGHDTTAFADPRSVESLIDFRQSNIRWLKKAGDDEIGRLMRHQQEAEETRDQVVNSSIQLEEYPQVAARPVAVVHLEGHEPARRSTDYEEIPIDPALENFDGSSLTLESIIGINQ